MQNFIISGVNGKYVAALQRAGTSDGSLQTRTCEIRCLQPAGGRSVTSDRQLALEIGLPAGALVDLIPDNRSVRSAHLAKFPFP